MNSSATCDGADVPGGDEYFGKEEGAPAIMAFGAEGEWRWKFGELRRTVARLCRGLLFRMLGGSCGQIEPRVVPACSEGAHEALPPGLFFPKPVEIVVHFGVARAAAELAGAGESRRQRIASGLRTVVAELKEAVWHG